MLTKLLKRTMLRFGYDVYRSPERTPRWSYTVADYNPVYPRPRWGHGLSSNQYLRDALEKGRENYERALNDIESHRDALHKIKHDQGSQDDSAPFWNNEFFSGLDAASLVGFLLSRSSKRYFEIGSGNSTLFARHAVTYGNLPTTITSIDPNPRRIVDAACDIVIRKPLEDCDLGLFQELEPGDLVFFDGSHRLFTNSDVAVFFLEVLPMLKPGVLVQVHDIFLPDDYPPAWNNRLYSEQYLLGAMLLCGARRFRVVLPNYFVCMDPVLSEQVRQILRAPEGGRDIRFFSETQSPMPGGSFWFEITSKV